MKVINRRGSYQQPLAACQKKAEGKKRKSPCTPYREKAKGKEIRRDSLGDLKTARTRIRTRGDATARAPTPRRGKQRRRSSTTALAPSPETSGSGRGTAATSTGGALSIRHTTTPRAGGAARCGTPSIPSSHGSARSSARREVRHDGQRTGIPQGAEDGTRQKPQPAPVQERDVSGKHAPS